MHSHDRTLIASLGFADKDKKESRHDLAVQYLMQGEKARAVVDHLTRTDRGRIDIGEVEGMPEVRLTKGEGKYETIIGFADLVLEFRVLRTLDVHESRRCARDVSDKPLIADIDRRWSKWRSDQHDAAQRDASVVQVLASVNSSIDWLLGNRCDLFRDGDELVVRPDNVPRDLVTARLAPLKPYLMSLLRHTSLAYQAKYWEEALKPPIANIRLRNPYDRQRDIERAVIESMGETQRAAEARALDQDRQVYLAQAVDAASKGDGWTDQPTGVRVYGVDRTVLVEVKILPVAVGDILRQFSLYTAHLKCDRRLLVTAFDLSVEDIESLETKMIQHMRLGQAFDDYCERRTKSPQASLSLEI